tara:strand:- start:825 stop:1049 length:225 start_codon:yes stop_codon:yes gene_type:complete
VIFGRIIILEIATPPWRLKPFLFRATWGGKPTWRVGWLGVSISAYRAEGLHRFFEQVERTTWKAGSVARGEVKS